MEQREEGVKGAPVEDERVGTLIEQRYQVLKRIGEGGMGTVYKAEHVLIKKTVALKLLRPELGRQDEIVKRFEREAQSASRLSHPGIIQVTDFGRTPDGILFLVMEFLAGESLAGALARRGRFAPAEAAAILRQVLAALDHAHSLGVVHRDLKPENIMLVRREGQIDAGGPGGVKLLDFGIAKMNEDAAAGGQPLTQAGVVFGTPHYMSPEQALGEPIDARSDLYSCGVILYELLTGRRPFEAERLVQVLAMHMTATPTPPRGIAPEAGIPEALEQVVLKALAKSRDERFGSAAEFLETLEGAVGEAGEAGGVAAGRPSRVLTVAGAGRSRLPQRITLTLDVERLRTQATGFWQGLPGRTRRLTIGAGAALATLALVLVLWGIGRPSHPKPVTPEVALSLEPAEAALTRGDLVAARAVLLQNLSKYPEAARVHYLMGTLEFLEHHPELGLASYRTAIQRDPGYRGDPIILRNVQPFIEDKKLGPLVVGFLAVDVGKPAAALLAAVASTDKRPEVRHTALAACQRLGCLAEVDQVQSYLLDLGQAKHCEERRDVVVRLGRLGDGRALDALHKLRKKRGGILSFFNKDKDPNECMKRELEEAIQAIEGR